MARRWRRLFGYRKIKNAKKIMPRTFPTSVKVAAFERANGQCQGCTAPLAVGKFHYDHKLPWWLGGPSSLWNCQVLCVNCHEAKTAGEDIPRIAKAKRSQAKHVGAKKARRPMFGSRASGWRKRMDGTVERR